MQTFLPYADFEQSARALDSKRLGKQRVEAYQILRTLEGVSKGWQNHPAVNMWRGYEPALRQYLRVCILEWLRRGYKNTMAIPDAAEAVLPEWIGNEAFHASHRANLKRKDPVFYQFSESSDLPYIWPENRTGR